MLLLGIESGWQFRMYSLRRAAVDDMMPRIWNQKEQHTAFKEAYKAYGVISGMFTQTRRNATNA